LLIITRFILDITKAKRAREGVDEEREDGTL